MQSVPVVFVTFVSPDVCVPAPSVPQPSITNTKITERIITTSKETHYTVEVTNPHTTAITAMFTATTFVILTYFFAAIPFGLLATTLFGGDVELRTAGSGNIGATNVARVTSWKIATPVLLLDISKGYIPTFFATNFWHFSDASAQVFVAIVALTAFSGHCFSIFLGFSGGKGVATGAGALLAITPIAATLGCLVWGILLALTGRSSVAALCATGSALLFTNWLSPEHLPVVGLIALGVGLRHAANIRRLMNGEESTVIQPVRWGQQNKLTAADLLSQRPDGTAPD
jgi:glycerol-3-phosphate acyltransferase PlsY